MYNYYLLLMLISKEMYKLGEEQEFGAILRFFIYFFFHVV